MSVFLGVFPFLSVYNIGIESVSIADMVLLILFFAFLLFETLSFTLNTKNGILLVLIFLVIYHLLFSEEASITSGLRFGVYLLTLLLLKNRLSQKLFEKAYLIMICFSTILVLIQFVSFTYFGFVVSNKIIPLGLMDKSFEQLGEYYTEFYRPNGIFLEPSHHGQLASLGLLLLLKERNSLGVFFFLLGIVLCGSSAGLAASSLILILFSWPYLVALAGFKKGVISLVVLLMLYFARNKLNIAVDRVMGDGLLAGDAFFYRFGGLAINFANFNFLDWLIGRGRGSEQVYLTSIFYTVNSFGLVGLVLLVRYLFVNKKEIFLVILLLLISEILTNYGLLILVPILNRSYENNYS